MKNQTTPTRHERFLKEGDFVVSKTDTQGKITYCNETFIELSGYTEKELLGIQHNIVRHPDMPRGVFKFLWDTIKQGNECFAYVKNMSKDGGFYWVFANITPDINEQGQIVGYFSVRRRPRAEAIKVISGIYSAMLAEEQKAGSRNATASSIAYLTSQLQQQNLGYEEFILSI